MSKTKKPSIQPTSKDNSVSFEATASLEKLANEVLSHYPEEQKRSAILPILHAIQQRFGYISQPASTWVAQKLGLKLINVSEVVTFYPGLRESPAGESHIRICRTLSCGMAGSQELMDAVCKSAKIDRSHCDSHKNSIATSPCGKWSVEFVECLASCDVAPVCLIGDKLHEKIGLDQIKTLLNKPYQPLTPANS